MCDITQTDAEIDETPAHTIKSDIKEIYKNVKLPLFSLFLF